MAFLSGGDWRRMWGEYGRFEKLDFKHFLSLLCKPTFVHLQLYKSIKLTKERELKKTRIS